MAHILRARNSHAQRAALYSTAARACRRAVALTYGAAHGAGPHKNTFVCNYRTCTIMAAGWAIRSARGAQEQAFKATTNRAFLDKPSPLTHILHTARMASTWPAHT